MKSLLQRFTGRGRGNAEGSSDVADNRQASNASTGRQSSGSGEGDTHKAVSITSGFSGSGDEEELAGSDHEGEESEAAEDEPVEPVAPANDEGPDPGIYEVDLRRPSMAVKWGFHWNAESWEAGERVLEKLAPNSPAAEWDRRNPGLLKVFDKLLTVNGCMGDLMVKELRRNHIKCRFKTDVVRLLLDHNIKHRPDPFASMSGAWLAGGLRGAIDEEEEEDEEEDEDWEFMDDEKREALQAKAREKAEKEEWEESEKRRRRQLASEAMGHVTWMRARKLQSDFVPHWQTLKRGQSLPKLQDVPQRAKDMTMESDDTDVWWKAPMPIVAGMKRKYWVWNDLFVNEVKHQAAGKDMALACVSVKAAQTLYRKNPALEHALQHHVVAVSSTGDRFFWSQQFVQLMDIAHQAQALNDGVVRFTEEEIHKIQPSIKFPVPGEYPQQLKLKPLVLPVPKSFSREKLINRKSTRPAPPPLPERLPCTIPYVLDAQWTTVLASKEQKAEFKYQQKMAQKATLQAWQATSAAFDALGGDDSVTESGSEEWNPVPGFAKY